MRHSFPISVLLSFLLAACASTPATPSKAVDQRGSLKVHPGLVGQPVPPELQPQDTPAPVAPAVEKGASGQPGNMKAAEIESSVYFDHKRAELKPESDRILLTHAAYLAGHPLARIRIEGNADERGPSDQNRKLGLQRAENVRQFLLHQGAADSQIKIVSLGEANPKRKGHNEESWAENRRADFVYEKQD